MLRRSCLRARCAISRLKWIPDLKQPTQHHADSQLRSIFSYCVMKELLHVNVVYCRHISLGRDRTCLLSLTGSDLFALSRRSDKNRGPIHERVCTEEQLLQVCCDGADKLTPAHQNHPATKATGRVFPLPFVVFSLSRFASFHSQGSL